MLKNNNFMHGFVIVIEQDQMPFVVEQDLRQDIFLSFNFWGVRQSGHSDELFVAQR